MPKEKYIPTKEELQLAKASFIDNRCRVCKKFKWDCQNPDHWGPWPKDWMVWKTGTGKAKPNETGN